MIITIVLPHTFGGALIDFALLATIWDKVDLGREMTLEICHFVVFNLSDTYRHKHRKRNLNFFRLIISIRMTIIIYKKNFTSKESILEEDPWKNL